MLACASQSASLWNLHWDQIVILAPFWCWGLTCPPWLCVSSHVKSDCMHRWVCPCIPSISFTQSGQTSWTITKCVHEYEVYHLTICFLSVSLSLFFLSVHTGVLSQALCIHALTSTTQLAWRVHSWPLPAGHDAHALGWEGGLSASPVSSCGAQPREQKVIPFSFLPQVCLDPCPFLLLFLCIYIFGTQYFSFKICVCK